MMQKNREERLANHWRNGFGEDVSSQVFEGKESLMNLESTENSPLNSDEARFRKIDSRLI